MASVTNVNGKVTAGNGLGPNTRILSITGTATQDSMDAVVAALTAGGTAGTDDAVVVAGIDGAVGDAVIHIAVQGTGVLTAASDYRGITGFDMAVVATFTD
jgi:hypothetical protein